MQSTHTARQGTQATAANATPKQTAMATAKPTARVGRWVWAALFLCLLQIGGFSWQQRFPKECLRAIEDKFAELSVATPETAHDGFLVTDDNTTNESDDPVFDGSEKITTSPLSNPRHSPEFKFEHMERSTTCKERQGLQNRTLLRIDTAREGGFPETQFTHYIQTGIIERLNTKPLSKRCGVAMLAINQEDNHSPVTVENLGNPDSSGSQLNYKAYMTIVSSRVFSKKCRRDLPRPSSTATSAVTMGLQPGDWSGPNLHRYHCFPIGSSPGGIFSIVNFLAIRAMAYKGSDELDGEFSGFRKVPWEERDPIPVWRGTMWGTTPYIERAHRDAKRLNRTGKEIVYHFYDVMLEPKGYHHQRLPLVGFSLKHPDLLNARGLREGRGKQSQITRQNKLLSFPNWNLTADNLYPQFNRMQPADLYSKYQVAVVMGGIGAAFRTGNHLSTGSAVILQEYPYEEWFVPYMTPYVDYIPLARDLSNLNETLHWVRDNPQKVKEIATNGRLFYERYLSFEKIEEFLYELVYRLSEAKIYKGIYLNIPESLDLNEGRKKTHKKNNKS